MTPGKPRRMSLGKKPHVQAKHNPSPIESIVQPIYTKKPEIISSGPLMQSTRLLTTFNCSCGMELVTISLWPWRREISMSPGWSGAETLVPCRQVQCVAAVRRELGVPLLENIRRIRVRNLPARYGSMPDSVNSPMHDYHLVKRTHRL